MAAFVHYAFGFPWLTAWLLGAVVSSTDASAVFSVLKERQLGLKGTWRRCWSSSPAGTTRWRSS